MAKSEKKHTGKRDSREIRHRLARHRVHKSKPERLLPPLPAQIAVYRAGTNG